MDVEKLFRKVDNIHLALVVLIYNSNTGSLDVEHPMT